MTRFRTLFFIFSVSLIISCSSTNKSVQYDHISSLPEFNAGLENLTLKSNMTGKFESQSIILSTKLKIAAEDSVAMDFSLLGMPVAKLYGIENYFQYYNIFENFSLYGVPSSDGLKEALNIDLSLSSIVNLLKCKLPNSNRGFVKTDNEEIKEGQILFVNESNANYLEYVLYSLSEKAMVQYQRKSYEGEILLNIFFKDYVLVDGFRLAKSVKFVFPNMNSVQKYEHSDMQVNQKYSKAFGFKVPSNAKKFEFR